MKTILNVLIILTISGLSSCISDTVGPAGPTGPQGNDGEKGDSGFVFEYEQVNFTAPDYEVFLPYPDNFESLNSDVALVYLLWGVDEVDGTDLEVWRQIPQTLLTDDGTLQYNFDFTMADVRLFMKADFDRSLFGAADTDDWVVRVVIVPGDFWNSAGRISSELPYDELKEMLGLPDMATPKSEIIRRNIASN